MTTGRIAFLCQPFHGHVHAMLGLAEECASRGHEVACVVGESFRDLVTATGSEMVGYPSPLSAMKSSVADVPADGFAQVILALLRENRAILEAAARRFADAPPDLLVYDLSATISANILRLAWGRPAIQLFPTFATDGNASALDELGDETPDPADDDPHMRQWQLEFDDALAAYGLAGTPDDQINPPCAEVNLVALPSSFQPGADGFDDRFHFVGPLFSPRTAAEAWQPRSADRPIVLVSLGTIGYERAEDFLRTCLAAFAGTEFHVVLTTPVAPETLGPLPGNVEVHPWVPQLAVLERASAFVCHGGTTSVMQALHTRTPMVAIPQHMDQPIVAERLRELGLGVVLRSAEVTAESLLGAVRAVVGDPETAGNLCRMRDQIRLDGGAPAAATVIEDTLRRARGPERTTAHG